MEFLLCYADIKVTCNLTSSGAEKLNQHIDKYPRGLFDFSRAIK